MRRRSPSPAGPVPRSLRRLGLACLLSLPLLVGPIALPARGTTEAGASTEGVKVQLMTGARAKIVVGGTAARIRVAGICTSGAEVLEAFVYITQDGFTSSFGFFPLICDGALHAWLVQVQALDVPFHTGAATASGYALVTDPQTGKTADDSPFRNITLFA